MRVRVRGETKRRSGASHLRPLCKIAQQAVDRSFLSSSFCFRQRWDGTSQLAQATQLSLSLSVPLSQLLSPTLLFLFRFASPGLPPSAASRTSASPGRRPRAPPLRLFAAAAAAAVDSFGAALSEMGAQNSRHPHPHHSQNSAPRCGRRLASTFQHHRALALPSRRTSLLILTGRNTGR